MPVHYIHRAGMMGMSCRAAKITEENTFGELLKSIQTEGIVYIHAYYTEKNGNLRNLRPINGVNLTKTKIKDLIGWNGEQSFLTFVM
jgi:hypothetical protein